MEFNDFCWHDAIVRSIQIDRTNPGLKDNIEFYIEFVEENKIKFIFHDVYLATMNLNFGIIADETILCAFEFEESDQDLQILNAKWGDILKDVILRVYKFNFNATGSEIKLIAKGFKVESL